MMRRFVAAVVVVAVVALFGWQMYRTAASTDKRSRRPARAAVAVEVAPVRKVTIRDVGRFTGSLRPRAYFVVAPKVAGRLRRLHVDIGDPVEPGRLIAELEDDEYAQKVEQARAELEVTRANLEQARSYVVVAKRELERAQALREKQISSESELDATRAQYEARHAGYKVALAQVAEREAALKATEIRLSYTRVRASWEDGSARQGTRFIGERFVDEGALLKANSPIVSVVDIAALVAVIHVTERDYSRLRPGLEASVAADAVPGRIFHGTIRRVAPLLKESSREATVEIEMPNPELILKPGMFVRVSIQFASRAEATVVPTAALARREGRRGVFLVDTRQKKAHFVPVEVGIVEDELAEIVEPGLSGLVVTLGQHLLEDGSDVILPGEKPAGPPPGRSGDGAQAGEGRRSTGKHQ